MDYLDPRDMDDSYSFPARFSANISAYELSALEAAADEGNIDSCVELAVYFHDLRVHDKSFAYALKAASSGHCEFQEWVASCYERGLGVTADIQEAIRWAKCAASQGSMSGAVKYARLARSVISKNKDNSLLGDLESVLSRDNLSKSMIVKYELAGAHLDARENEKGIELLKQVVEKKGDLEREYYARAAHRLAQYYLY